MRSAPSPPSRVLLPALPVRLLFSALPVPLIAATPVSTRFSTLAPSVWVTEDRTVSVPALAASLTTSPALSTT